MSILVKEDYVNPDIPLWASASGGGGGGGSLNAGQFVVNTAVTYSGDTYDFNPGSTFQVTAPNNLFPTGNTWYQVNFNVYCGPTVVEDVYSTPCSIIVYNNDPNYTYPASYHQFFVNSGAPFSATNVKANVFIGPDPTGYDVVIEFTNQGVNVGSFGNITHLVYNIDGFSALCLGPGTVIAPP